MKKRLVVCALCAWALSSQGQLYDDFSDGNLSENPAWYGHTGLFAVQNEELRLLDPTPASNNLSFLYLPAPVSTDTMTVWEWYVRLDFAPSTTNYARIYLQASGPDLGGEQWGYYLKIGGISGAGDAVELFRQDGASSALLISGTAGAVGNQPAIARVRVTRSAEGVWALYADYQGGYDFQLEGEASDLTHPKGAYCGLVCVYTSTRNDDFYFDDVFINPLYIDKTPPQLQQAEALGPTLLRLSFDEALDEASATDTARYLISGGVGRPAEALWDADTPGVVRLVLGQALSPLQVYSIQAEGIRDEAGNEGGLQSLDFMWIPVEAAAPYDVLISEIMADPSPPVGLPNAEYLEIYNRSDKILQLQGWTLSDGGSPAVFPTYLLYPGHWLILCREADLPLLAPYGPALGLAGFPGLNNAGEQLALRDAEGRLVHWLGYTSEWYRESAKSNGGWSLELINPLSPCEGASNWRASAHPLGGTPGKENAVWAPGPVTMQAEPIAFFPNTPNRGTLTFSMAMSDPQPGDLIVEPPLEIESVRVSDEDPRKWEIEWTPALEAGVVYEMRFLSGVADCGGNALSPHARISFGLPEPLTQGAIVVNEIMYQPDADGVEYLELYNRGGKIYNLGDLLVGAVPVQEDRLFLPGAYLVLCRRPLDLMARHPQAPQANVVAFGLPSLPDGGGNIVLYAAAEGFVVDAVAYHPSWHHALLPASRGVSLERIDPYGESQSAANWQSAAADAGHATPGAPNSQLLRSGPAQGDFFLPYKTFDPGDPGERTFLSIVYELERPGAVGSVRIFDAMGRLVRVVAHNQLLGAAGSFRWDGDDWRGGKARTGIYIAWAQWHYTDGKRGEKKMAFVLAGR
jgi:hypothetical protein